MKQTVPYNFIIYKITPCDQFEEFIGKYQKLRFVGLNYKLLYQYEIKTIHQVKVSLV